MPSFPTSGGIYSYALCPLQHHQDSTKISCKFLMLSTFLLMLYLILRSFADLDKIIHNPNAIKITLFAQFIRCCYASIMSLSLCIILRYVLYNHPNPIIGYLNTIKQPSTHLIASSFISILIFSFFPHLLFTLIHAQNWNNVINNNFIFQTLCTNYLECTFFDDNIYLFFHDNFATIIFFPFLCVSIYCIYLKCKHQTVLEMRSSNLELTMLDRNSIMQFTTFTIHHLSEDPNGTNTDDAKENERRNTMREITACMDELMNEHSNPYMNCLLYLCVFIMHRFVYCILKDIKRDFIKKYVHLYYICVVAFYGISKVALKRTARVCDEIIVGQYHRYIQKLIKCKESKFEIPSFDVLSLEYLMECYTANVYFNFYRNIIFFHVDHLDAVILIVFFFVEVVQSAGRLSKVYYNRWRDKSNSNGAYDQWAVRIFLDCICRCYACLFSGIFIILSVFFEIKQSINQHLFKPNLILFGLEITMYGVIVSYISGCLDSDGMKIFVQYLQSNKCYIVAVMAYIMITVVL